MNNRMSFPKAYPDGYKALSQLEKFIVSSGLTEKHQELIKLRASQINGCVFCLDLHLKDARKLGFTDQQLMTLSAWFESPFFDDDDKVILALTDAVTLIADEGVPQEVYDDALDLLGEEGLAKVLMAICMINTWNRLMVTTEAQPGSHTPK